MDPSPQCEGLFQLFDVDRSGQIDVREFMISLTNFAGASKDDKLKFAFMIFDEDGNGVITKQEVNCTVECMGLDICLDAGLSLSLFFSCSSNADMQAVSTYL